MLMEEARGSGGSRTSSDTTFLEAYALTIADEDVVVPLALAWQIFSAGPPLPKPTQAQPHQPTNLQAVRSLRLSLFIGIMQTLR